MPDAKPVRMWGVWDWELGRFTGGWCCKENAQSYSDVQNKYGGNTEIIPGTFTPDEEGSDENDS